MLDPKVLDKLNRLIALDIDAIGCYESALRACSSNLVRHELEAFKTDHERHVRDLGALVRVNGGAARTGRDLKGFFIQGFTAIASLGDESALLAMRGNEELTNRTYKSALEDPALPVSVEPLIARNYADEQRHLAWIKDALAHRLWESEQPSV